MYSTLSSDIVLFNFVIVMKIIKTIKIKLLQEIYRDTWTSINIRNVLSVKPKPVSCECISYIKCNMRPGTIFMKGLSKISGFWGVLLWPFYR